MTTISFQDEGDLLLKSGLHFLDELRRDAGRPNANLRMRADWAVIADWLEHHGGSLDAEQRTRLSRAWAAYLAIGLAPSRELQSAFTHFSPQMRAAPSDRPPTEVMNVFDRLLATDDQIARKRQDDWAAERARFDPVFQRLKHGKPARADLTTTRATRTWIFASVVWFAGVLLYAAIFDPFDGGGWDRMSDNETLRVFVVACLPVVGWSLLRTYRRWIA